jgi:CDP-diacylglycerol---serine O-phosphatidyltransferase
MKLYRHIPNLITLSNLFLGMMAIEQALLGHLEYASYFIVGAAVLDFLDGFLARLLNAYSEIGKQLDSLADVVSFGVAPAFILYKMLQANAPFFESPTSFHFSTHLILYSPFLIALFSALRLAKFNIDPRQSSSFIGLPTPASALFISSLPLLTDEFGLNLSAIFAGTTALVFISVILSGLMVSGLPLFSMKFKDYQFRNNWVRYSFMVLSIVLLSVFWLNSIPLILFMYVGISVLIAIFARHK